MSILNDFTDDFLKAAEEAHTYRRMRHICTPEASHVGIWDETNACEADGNARETAADTTGEKMRRNLSRDVILLASNSYLDLCNEPELKKAAADAVLKWGTGSGGARLTTGNKTPHEELERTIAEFKGEEAALTFGTGYMANVGVISALCSKQVFVRTHACSDSIKGGDTSNKSTEIISQCVVFSDELNHASIIDGIRLSKAKCYVYKHNDMEDLQRVIDEAQAAQSRDEKKIGANPDNEPKILKTRYLIVTDAVFSMDGDLANLPELQRIAKKNNCLLMIDEAHATGVIGHSGKGLAEHYKDKGIPCEHADVTVGTLSKSVGCEGGFVVGKKNLIEFLKNKARSFIFTTAMSPAMAQAAANNLKFIAKHPERVQQLQDNVKFFCDVLQKSLGSTLQKISDSSLPDFSQNSSRDDNETAASTISFEIATESAIVPIVIGDEALAMEASAALLQKGILIPAIRYPTVAKGKARLRASLMATHTKEELQAAADAIADVLRQA